MNTIFVRIMITIVVLVAFFFGISAISLTAFYSLVTCLAALEILDTLKDKNNESKETIG